jgi:hypothetical protein
MSPDLVRLGLRVTLGGSELERLVVVGGNLEYLISLPRDRLLTHTEVRLSAAVLRRLLVDRQLSKLWQTMNPPAGMRLSVEATDLDAALKQWPEGWIRNAWAGGAISGAAHHGGWIVAVVPEAEHAPYGSPEAYFEANPLPQMAGLRRMSVHEWMSSTSVAIQTDTLGLVGVSRASVLTYIAKRKGGVHFDPSRNLAGKKGRKERREIESLLLDHGLLRVGHLSGPEYEVASIAYTVAGADWAGALVKAAQQMAPAEFDGDPRELKFWTGAENADGTGWATTTFNAPQADESQSPDDVTR